MSLGSGEIAAEQMKFDDESSEYMDVALTGEEVERMNTDSSGEEFEEKIDDPSTEIFANDDSFQSTLPESPMELEIETGDPTDTEMDHRMEANLPPTVGRNCSLKPKVLFPSEGKICSRTRSRSRSPVTAPVQAVQRIAPAETEQQPNRCSIMLLSCSINSAAIANMSNQLFAHSRGQTMPGSGRGKKKAEPPPVKEKKGPSTAEIRAENKATGQQGKASAASVHAGYGLSMICNCRSKAEIAAEFWARNDLETGNTLAWHNRQIYQRFYDDHKLRRTARNSIFWRGKAVAEGSPCYSLSKNQLEKHKWRPKEEVPWHSMNGDSTDYDTEADEKMSQVLATLPPLVTLPLAPSLPQPPATDSGAGLQAPPPPPPTPSRAEQASLSRKAIHHTPPASESEQEVRAKQAWSPSVLAPFDQEVKWEAAKKRAEAKKKRPVVPDDEHPVAVPPGMVPAKPGAGALISDEQLQVVQETLDATQSQVPADAPPIP